MAINLFFVVVVVAVVLKICQTIVVIKTIDFLNIKCTARKNERKSDDLKQKPNIIINGKRVKPNKFQWNEIKKKKPKEYHSVTNTVCATLTNFISLVGCFFSTYILYIIIYNVQCHFVSTMPG